MRNKSEEEEPETLDMTDPESVRRRFSKVELSEALVRMRRQLKRIKKQRDKAMTQLRGEVLTTLKGEMEKDMGHEHNLSGGASLTPGISATYRCHLCGLTYVSTDRGVCAGKVNAKLDAIVALDQYVS